MIVSLLGAALGGIALAAIFLLTLVFARGAAYLAGETRWSVALALGTMLQICVPISICRATEDMVIATLIHGALMAAGLALLWRKGPIAAPLVAAPSVRLRRAVFFLALLALTFVIWAAVKNYLWDELNGHDPLASVIARGVSPPELPFFPGEPFRYHYGFDVLSGEVRAFTGLFAPYAVDVVTILCFILLLVTGASIGAALAGDRGAELAMLLAPFGTGTLLYFVLPELGSFQVRLPFFPSAWTESVPPPIISNFFQHPQGLAMPVSIGVLLLFDGTETSERTRLLRVLLGSILLGMLSLAQVAFFSVLGLSLGVSVVARAIGRRRFSRMALELACLCLALLIAYALGGFFERSSGPTPARLIEIGRSLFQEPPLRSIAHHLVVFGLPLLALPLSLLRLRERAPALRIALIAGAAIGFAIPNLMVYSRSWDIVKFYGVGGFFANILLADTLSPLFVRRGARRVAGLVLVILASFVGWFWIVRMSVLDGVLGVPKMHFGPPPAIAQAVAKKLGPLVKPRQRVFSTNMDMGAGAGFLTPGFDPISEGGSQMLDRERLYRLHEHYESARRTLKPEDLDALGVDWVVFSKGDVESLDPEGKKALEDPSRFEHVFDVTLDQDMRQVYRIIRARDGH